MESRKARKEEKRRLEKKQREGFCVVDEEEETFQFNVPPACLEGI